MTASHRYGSFANGGLLSTAPAMANRAAIAAMPLSISPSIVREIATLWLLQYDFNCTVTLTLCITLLYHVKI